MQVLEFESKLNLGAIVYLLFLSKVEFSLALDFSNYI